MDIDISIIRSVIGNVIGNGTKGITAIYRKKGEGFP